MKFKPANTEMVEVNMTPMIDIVFQLIAFFMVVINFEQSQADERVKLPRDELARPPKTARPDKRVINIGFHRDKDGKTHGDAFVLLPGTGEEYPWPAKEEQFKKDLGAIQRSLERDKKLKETVIIIRADSEAPGGITTDIVAACQAAGFEKFAFSATVKGRVNDVDK